MNRCVKKKAFSLTQLAFLLICLSQTGCSTISPNVTESKQASIGTNGAHSNVFGWRFDADTGQKLQLWYPEKRVAYDGYIAKWGNQFTPPLTADYHLTQDYPRAEWIDAQTGHLIAAPPGLWEADGEAIAADVELIAIKAGAKTP